MFKKPTGKIDLVTGSSILPNRLLAVTGIPSPEMITRLIPEITSPLAVDYNNMQLGTGKLAKAAGVAKILQK